MFPDYKVRDIFDDIKEVKQGDKDLSIVKVYRNPPTTVELADPRRFDSLPPDSFARPIKRPPSPYLRPPPPPLFADATRNEAHDAFNHPNPRFNQVEDHTQAPNKRQKIQAYGSNAYTNDPDQAIDSREVADHDYMFSPTIRRHPSQEPQVEDSQTSPLNKRKSVAALLSGSPLKCDLGSDPYGTPISSQISQLEHGRTREAEMVSVPDSPPDRVIVHGRESVPPATANSDSRSSSPELPSSLGRSSQLQEARARVQSSISLPQTRQSLKTSVESQAWPLAQLPVNRKIVSPSGKPDFWSELEEAEQDQRLEPPEATRTASRMMNPRIPSNDCTMSRSNTAVQALPLLGTSKCVPQKSDGDTEKGGRLKRPNVLKSALAPQGTPKLINGIRQKAPSITGIFDPIETSEGSSYERELPRSLKRARTTIPKKNLRKTASQKAASRNSLIVRLRVPQVTQQRSSAVSSPEVSRDNMMVDAQETPEPASTQEPGSQAADGEFQNRSTESPHPTNTGDPAHHSSNPYNAIAASNEQAQSLTKLAKLKPDSSSPGTANQTNSTVTSVQRTLVLPNKDAVGTVSSSHNLEEEMGDESLARKLKEAQEVKEKAQAEFDRITALQKKRQGLQDSKASPLAADSVAIETFHADEEKERQAAAEAKTSETQAEARKKRRAKEQKDKEARMAIAKRIEEEKRSEIEEENSERVKMRSEQERPASKQKPKDVKLAQQQEVKVNQLTYTKRASEGQSSQEAPKQTPGSERKEDNLPVKIAVEAAKAKRNEAKSMVPTERAIRDSNLSKLAERSPKARLNAQRQLQIANEALKYSNNDFETIKTPAAKATSNVAKSTARAPKVQQNSSVKQAAKKTRGDTQEPNGQRRSEAGIFANHVDDTSLRATRAAGLPLTAKSTTTSSKGFDTAATISGTPEATAVDLAADGPTRLSKEPLRRSSSSSTTRNEPGRARTMTPAIPSSSMQSFPDSAEARARRAASVNVKNLKTPTRNDLPAKISASGRSVSFAGESVISQLHNGKTVDQKSTPTPSDQSSRMSKMGKTPQRTKQTTMTQHIDRKLKGKMTDPPSPIRVPIEKQIIISSESEASTLYSDESEGERNARAGPSSRKKPKPRNSSSSISASAVAASNSGGTYPTITGTNTHPAAQNPSGASSQPASQPVKTPSKTVVQIDDAKPSPSDGRSDSEKDSRSSRSASAASTDDISNLPQIGGVKKVRPESHTRGKNDLVLSTSTPPGEDVSVTALRVRDEERLQLEANEQLQREYSQAMQAKTTIDIQPSEVEGFKKVNGQSRQTTKPAVRAEHEKYGSRVRINPTYENVSLSQLVKAQATEPMSLNGSAKRFPSPKPIDQPTVESSSASDSEESSSSGSIDLLKKAHGTGLGTTPQKKRVLPSVWRDLYGREASGKKYQ